MSTAKQTSHDGGSSRSASLDELELLYVDPKKLKPYERNARTHSKKQIKQIAASIKEFGFTNPVLVDRDGGIIAGHGRVEAAKQLKLEEIPTVRLDHLSEAQKRAYIIADNRLAELAGWDEDILAIELQFLSDPELELDFDLEIIGFETSQIDLIIDGAVEDGEPDPADEQPEIDEDAPAVSKAGDIWLLDKHRLMCGDALKQEDHDALMEGETAQMIFTDPPYNVPVDGHVCGLGGVRHREFAMASGEMTQEEFASFLESVLGRLVKCAKDGALLYVCMDWRHMKELLLAGERAGLKLVNLCVWNKNNGGMGSMYRSKHELVFVFKTGGAPHRNNIQLGQYGRYRTNVWDYAGVNSFRKGRDEELAMHPTVKPVALVADAIRDCTSRNDMVVDSFVGSGTTLLAAEKTGRIAYGMEIDPLYVDAAIRRWEAYTGRQATHAQTGRTFRQAGE